jgi:hypothetical protein
MKAKNYFNLLFTLVVLTATILPSCKTSFPIAGTPVECNGKVMVPIKNPTKRAAFPGGQQAMYKFLRENINLSQGTIIKGNVRVAFIVTKDGKICDIRITSKPRKYIDNEVTRVIKLMPKWIPGYNEDEIVDCYFLLEIKF